MTDATPISADLPILCALCFTRGRIVKAVAVIGGDSVCDPHLDGHCARADLELEALERWHP